MSNESSHVNWDPEVKEPKPGQILSAEEALEKLKAEQALQEVEEAELEKNKGLPCSLRHFANSIPGFTEGKGSRQKIEPWPFKDLLTHEHPIVIPLFQRKYCWEKAQGDKWWDDLLAMELKNCIRGFNHGVGKVVFLIKETEGILCIDGQQRATTTSLLVSSIRDQLLKELRQLPPPPSSSSAQKGLSSSSEAGNVSSRLSAIVRRLNSYLYLDPQAAVAWSREQGAKTNPGQVLDMDSVIGDGVLLPFSRLKPSHIDRQPYFQCLMQGLIQDTQCQQPPLEAQWGPVTQASLQGPMKRVFDEKVQGYFGPLLQQRLEQQETGGTCTGGSRSELLVDWTETLLTKALEGMSFTYVEILNDVNLAEVFLNLQEHSVLGKAQFLRNDAPGLDFRASDMARNLLLAPSMNWPLHVQERLHMQHWVRPIEGCYRRPDDIDRVLRAFLEEAEEDIREGERVRAQLARYLQKSEEKKKNKNVTEKRAAPEKEKKQKRIVSNDDSNDYDPFGEVCGDVAPPHKKQNISNKKGLPPPPANWVAQLAKRRYVSENEKGVLELVHLCKSKRIGKQDTEGMELYARFYSYYENQLMEEWKDKQRVDRMKEREAATLEEEEKEEPGSTLTVEDVCDEGEVEVTNRSSSLAWTKQLTPEEQCEWELDRKILACLGYTAQELKEDEVRRVVSKC